MSSNINPNYGGNPSDYQPRLSKETLNQAKQEINEAYQQKSEGINQFSTSMSNKQEVEKTQLQADLHMQNVQLESNQHQFSNKMQEQSLASQQKDMAFKTQLQNQELERARMLEEKKKLLDQKKQNQAIHQFENKPVSHQNSGSYQGQMPQFNLNQSSQINSMLNQQQQNIPGDLNQVRINPNQVNQMQKQSHNMQQQMKAMQDQMKQQQKEKKENCKIF